MREPTALISTAIVDGLEPGDLARLGELLETGRAEARVITTDAANALAVALGAQAASPGGTADIEALLSGRSTDVRQALASALPASAEPTAHAGGAAPRLAWPGLAGAGAHRVAALIGARRSVAPSRVERVLVVMSPVVLADLAHERAAGTSSSALGVRLIAERDRLAVADPSLVAATQADTTRMLGADEALGPDATDLDEEARRKQRAARWRRRFVWPLAAAFAVLGVILALLLAEFT